MRIQCQPDGQFGLAQRLQDDLHIRMFVSGQGPQTPTGLHAYFSIGVGGGVPISIHEHKGIMLFALLGLWVGMHLFMHVRGQRARGVFIDEKVGEFDAGGIGGFLLGLLLTSIYFAVW